MQLTRLSMAMAVVLAALSAGGCATPLFDAARDGDTQTVRTLLSQGEKPDGGGGVTSGNPLHWAAMKGNVEIMQLLLDKGADINASVVYGTPLHWASRGGQVKAVQVLLDRGANVDAKNNRGWTPLHYAAQQGYIQVARLLLERGAVPGIGQPAGKGKTGGGGTAATIAREGGHDALAQLLEQAEGGGKLAVLPDGPVQESDAMSRKQQKKLERAGKQKPGSEPEPREAPSPPPAVPASDVDTPPSAKGKPRPHAYAVVIGIETYREQLPKADFGAQDARTVGVYVTNVMGYPEENVALLVNERATRTDIEKHVESWLPNRVEKDDTVFVYFSGHGAPNPKTGDAYLVPYDGDPAFVDKTGYSVKRLYEQLGKLPAKEVVVLLDSCFSGAGGKSVLAPGARPMVLTVENPLLANGKTVVLAASAGDQISSTYKQKGHGLLTYFFLKGLQGEADRNKDGSVDLSELFDYVKPQVSRVARREFNNDQTPQLLGNPAAKGIRLVEQAK